MSQRPTYTRSQLLWDVFGNAIAALIVALVVRWLGFDLSLTVSTPPLLFIGAMLGGTRHLWTDSVKRWLANAALLTVWACFWVVVL